ncbi:hypothetical protein CO054_00925 [Candidatus Shapirobacteria bacterium CG_4_9_14_0_2_um_filter_39_11]|uniref:Peptidase M16 n=1 Tax=Candidatus Shapirobacteria bacterium CG_4_9_14_0_2_um_filter_39_11 TaxID=1974478 RepID=A0A2M8ET41_9BACT|nr:MAG: hypothetical protein CO054_00925 [Candidatus Shapirobacteria bacterium CG_4_9_14_0_2_um_filter_39_11]
MDNYKITTLKNGLRLITVPMPQMESVTVMVGVGAGSRYETKKVNGLFHFIEHMAFKGTKKRPTTLAIASEVDGVGGEFNAFTDKEFTGYYLKLASKHTKLAFDILSDMLTNSLFKPEEIEREKGVIIEEINMYEDTPIRRIWDVFIRLLYGDNPMGWDIAGESRIIKAIKRQDFLRCIDRLYYPENMVVAVAGKLNDKEIKNMTENFFSSLRAAARQSAGSGDARRKAGQKVTKSIKIKQNQPRLKLINKTTEQGHFCLGVPGYNLFHKDRFALGILAAILGGGMSSRLFLEIREKRGLAYYVGSEVDYYTDSGFLLNRAGVRLEKIQEAIKIVLEELANLTSKKVSQKELNKAKEFTKGGLILALEDSKNIANRYAAQLILEGQVRTPEQTLKLINKVTVEDVQRVAKDIFKPQKLNLAIIGPYKEETRFKKLLKT